jgi:hypothetical protein
VFHPLRGTSLCGSSLCGCTPLLQRTLCDAGYQCGNGLVVRTGANRNNGPRVYASNPQSPAVRNAARSKFGALYRRPAGKEGREGQTKKNGGIRKPEQSRNAIVETALGLRRFCEAFLASTLL